MKLTPRGNEYKAVIPLLESDEFASAEALAKAVVKAVYDELIERDWFIHAYRAGPGSPVVAWGPFSSEKELERFAASLDCGGQHIGRKLFSPAKQARVVAENALVGTKPIVCDRCGHPAGPHLHDTRMGQCQIRGCSCKNFKESK